MKKNNKNVVAQNYLQCIPKRKEGIAWKTDGDGIITLEIENKGIFNRVAQKLFKKPKITYIHLDEIGSVVWPLLDGEKNIMELGKDVEAKLGERVQPLYERLSKYIGILKSYDFVTFESEK